MHDIVNKHPQPITSIQRADGWGTIFFFSIILFPLWWRLF